MMTGPWPEDEAAPPSRADSHSQTSKTQHGPNGHDDDWRQLDLIKFADMRPRLAVRPLIKGILEREQLSIIRGEPLRQDVLRLGYVDSRRCRH
jgi:hypothetical protein